jgi:hypothetical protein
MAEDLTFNLLFSLSLSLPCFHSPTPFLPPLSFCVLGISNFPFLC